MTLLVTGGAGFIGGNFVLDWIAGSDEPVVNLDKLTYAGNLETLSSLQGKPQHIFVQGDIGDRALLDKLLAEHKPRAVINFAAESHVDRSIHGPGEFIATNIVGTYLFGLWTGRWQKKVLSFWLYLGRTLAILAFVWKKAMAGGYSAHDHHGMETGASYWHMVDLVWIILFPLVDVMR